MDRTHGLRILMVANWDFEVSANPWAIQRMERLRAAGVDVEVLAVDCINDRGGYLKLWRALNARLKSAPRIDVVAPLYGSLLGLLCTLQWRAPVAIHFAGTDINGRPTPGKITMKSLSMPMSQVTAALSRGVAVANPDMREALWWPWARKSARVIEFGVDPGRFRPMARAEARRRRGLPLDGTRVAFVVLRGKVDHDPRPYKRLELAEAAVRRVPGAVLDVLEHIPFDEMPAAYCACDALILTSLDEGSPNCVKEALACALPVVSTDVGDVRQIVTGLTNCAVVPPEPEAFARALTAALTDGRGCPEGPERMAAEHSIQAMTQEFVRFYRAAAG
jgi:hypothetical protein